MNAKILATAILLCLFSFSARCQNPGLYFETLDINNGHARFYNASDNLWDTYSHSHYEVPAGSGINASFMSSLWIGGRDLSSNLHLAGSYFRFRGVDFYPGPYRTTGNYENGNYFAPNFQVEDVVGLTNGRIVFLHDTMMVEYDPASGNTRTYLYAGHRAFPGLIELGNGNLLLFGDIGFPNTRPLVEIDPTTFTGTVVDSLPDWHGPTQVELLQDGRVLFAGVFGCSLYDPATQSASPAAPMNVGRMRGASVLLPNGNVLVSGGGNSLNISSGLASMEIYDPVQNTWTAAPDMTGGRYDHSMILMTNGEVLIAGGNYFARTFDHYDPVTDSLRTPGVFPPFFKESKMTNMADGRVLISCNDYQWDPSTNLFYYDPVTGAIGDGKSSGVVDAGAVLANGNLMPVFRNGIYREVDSETTALAGQKWQKVWKVNKDEIDLFIQDFQNGTVDFDKYPVILDWPAHGSVADGEDYMLAPFVDVDQDSLYDPAGDGDYPCILGDQALWWVMNDDAGPHNATGGTKMGIQVEAMAYAFKQDSTSPVLWLDHSYFLHYEVTNKSFTAYNDVYISAFETSEIGNYHDDAIGSDSALGLAFMYNEDAHDDDFMSYPAQTPSIPTDHFGYGDNPPAVGNIALSGPNSDKFTHIMTFEDTTNAWGFPSLPETFYNLQQSKWTNGDPLTYGGDGHSGTVPTNYVFSGDPGFCGTVPLGWVQAPNAASFYNEYLVQSIGPFDLGAGETVNFDYAKIYARSYNFENLASVCELKAAASQIKTFFANLDKSCINLSVGDEEAVDLPLVSMDLYPNPTSGLVTLELAESVRASTEVLIYDLFGHSLKSFEIRAGQRSVTFDTDDLPNGVYVIQVDLRESRATTKLTVQH